MPEVASGYKDGMAMTFDVIKPKKGVTGAGILAVMSGAWYSDLPPVNRRIFRESPLGHNGPGKDSEDEEVWAGADR